MVGDPLSASKPSQDRYLIIQSAGEIRLRSGAQAGRIARKSGDRATMIDVVAVGSRQIPVYIAPKSGGGLIDGRPRDIDELGIPLSDCRRKHLGNQYLLRLKVVVEAALRKAGVLLLGVEGRYPCPVVVASLWFRITELQSPGAKACTTS
jgi:hypothetical protein